MHRRFRLAVVVGLSACFAAPIALAQTQPPQKTQVGLDRGKVERMREKQQLRREVKERADEALTEEVRRKNLKCKKLQSSDNEDALTLQVPQPTQASQCSPEAASNPPRR